MAPGNCSCASHRLAVRPAPPDAAANTLTLENARPAGACPLNPATNSIGKRAEESSTNVEAVEGTTARRSCTGCGCLVHEMLVAHRAQQYFLGFRQSTRPHPQNEQECFLP